MNYAFSVKIVDKLAALLGLKDLKALQKND
jgi:hypothetical protein